MLSKGLFPRGETNSNHGLRTCKRFFKIAAVFLPDYLKPPIGSLTGLSLDDYHLATTGAGAPTASLEKHGLVRRNETLLVSVAFTLIFIPTSLFPMRPKSKYRVLLLLNVAFSDCLLLFLKILRNTALSGYMERSSQMPFPLAIEAPLLILSAHPAHLVAWPWPTWATDFLLEAIMNFVGVRAGMGWDQ